MKGSLNPWHLIMHQYISCVSIQGLHPLKDAAYEGHIFVDRVLRRPNRPLLNETVYGGFPVCVTSCSCPPHCITKLRSCRLATMTAAVDNQDTARNKGCVPIQGLHPSKDASFEGCSLRRPRRLHRRPNERCGMGRSSLRSISGLRHQPLTFFTLRDHALLLSPSNPDSCVSNRTAEEKYGARNHNFLFHVLYFIGVGDDSPPEPAGEEEERTYNVN